VLTKECHPEFSSQTWQHINAVEPKNALARAVASTLYGLMSNASTLFK